MHACAGEGFRVQVMRRIWTGLVCGVLLATPLLLLLWAFPRVVLTITGLAVELLIVAAGVLGYLSEMAKPPRGFFDE